MTLEYVQTDTTANDQLPEQAGTHLQGGWLLLARVVWIVALVVAVGLFLSSLPFTFADAHTICDNAACSHSSYLTPDLLRQLQQLGLSIHFYAVLLIMWPIILELVYIAVGVVIFWRKSNDRMALFSSLALLTFGTSFRGFNPEATLPSLLHTITFVMAFFGNCCQSLFFYLFPRGQFAPRWIGFLILAWVILWGINNLVLVTIITYPGLGFLLFLGLLVSIVVTQVYRYRRFSTPLERQQTKWVIFGVSLALLGVITVFSVEMAVTSLSIIPHLILGSLLYIFLLLIPLSIGIAILRYRLWDIDIILNRTLVYRGAFCLYCWHLRVCGRLPGCAFS